MAEVKPETKTETKPKKIYRFASSGNITINLAGSRPETIVNDAGRVIGTRVVPAVRAVFENGYFETTDPDIVQLLTSHPQHWGNDVYWHPTSVPQEEGDTGRATAKKLTDAQKAHAERRRKGMRAALEGNVPTDRT